MNAPDPNLIATLDEKGRLQPVDQQPDVFTRLEAWLAESPDRFVGQVNKEWAEAGGFRVELGNRRSEESVVALENWTGMGGVAIAKAPGLAATIIAALEKAEKVKL